MTEMEKHIKKLTRLADELLTLSNRMVPPRPVEPSMFDSVRAIRHTLEETVVQMRNEIAKQRRVEEAKDFEAELMGDVPFVQENKFDEALKSFIS